MAYKLGAVVVKNKKIIGKGKNVSLRSVNRLNQADVWDGSDPTVLVYRGLCTAGVGGPAEGEGRGRAAELIC